MRFRKDIANHPPYDKCKAVFRAQYGAIRPYIDIPVFKPRTARSDGSQGHNAPSGGRRRANHMSHPSDIEDWSIAELLERRPECALAFHGQQDVLVARLPARGHRRLVEVLRAMRFGTPPIRRQHSDASYPVLLRQAGYHTGLIGKFGVGVEPGDEVIVPSGEDRVLAGDSVVLIGSAESLGPTRKLFLDKK